jgi:SLT domain-containing protein
MFDPVSNIAASINYIRRTYGDISQVQQANPNMPHMGYDQGGFMLDKPALNSTGKPEMVLPPDLTNTLMSLHKMVQGGQSGSSSKASVSVTNNITTVPMDPHETAGAVSSAVMWELRR